MYGQQSTLATTGFVTGSGLAFGLTFGWLLLAGFVLAMALVALLAIAPRRRREVRKVNPLEASQVRPRPSGG